MMFQPESEHCGGILKKREEAIGGSQFSGAFPFNFKPNFSVFENFSHI